MISAAFLSLLYAVFAYRHLAFGLAHPSQWWLVAPIIVQETSFMVLFAVRRNGPTTMDPWAWFVGLAGAFGPLLLRIEPRPGIVAEVGGGLQATGLVLSTVALWTLGRSVGIVAANRGLVVGGVYDFVRHPMYAAHLLVLVGYGMASPTDRNLSWIFLTMVWQVTRIYAEELWLEETSREWCKPPPTYWHYRQRVRWRLIPGVW